MRQRDENKEQAIKQQAMEMLVKEGFNGLSMQKLAKAVGVSPATIYIYFKDKEDLLSKITEEEATKMQDATLEGFDPELDFEDGMRIQWKNRARYFIENPLNMLFLEQMRNTQVHEKKMRLDTRFAEVMTHFVHRAIERGQLAQLPMEIYWAIAYAPLYQLVKFHLANRPVFPLLTKNFEFNEQQMELALRLVLKSLKPEKP